MGSLAQPLPYVDLMEGVDADSKGGGQCHVPQNVPRDAFPVVSDEPEDIGKGKYGLDIPSVQNTRSGQLELP